jgi:hypothetical protein
MKHKRDLDRLHVLSGIIVSLHKKQNDPGLTYKETDAERDRQTRRQTDKETKGMICQTQGMIRQKNFLIVKEFS